MPFYTFSQITAGQALAYNAATDALLGASGPATLNLTFDDAARQVSVTDQGRTVTFGSGIYGEQIEFSNTSARVYVGSPASEILSLGTATGAVFLGSGDDTFIAGSGPNTVNGGAGSDLFIYDSAAAESGVIAGWDTSDRIHVSTTSVLPTSFNYVELTAPDVASAVTQANAQISGGIINYVVVGVAFDVHIFIDSQGFNTAWDRHIVVSNALSLQAVGPENFANGPVPVAAPVSPPPPPPPPPPPFVTSPAPPPLGTVTPPVRPAVPAVPALPSLAVNGSVGTISGRMDGVRITDLVGGTISPHTSSHLTVTAGDDVFDIRGSGFTYDSNDQITGGAITQVSYRVDSGQTLLAQLTTPGVSAGPLTFLLLQGIPETAFGLFLNANDDIGGGFGSDQLRTYSGDDLLYGNGGSDTLAGGFGNDLIFANAPPGRPGGVAGSSLLFGESGSDTLVGAAGNDTLNGFVDGGLALGGEGNDSVTNVNGPNLVFGESGADSLQGGYNSDTLVGGAGQSYLRGAEGDDMLVGDDLFDDMHGNQGNDTLMAGAFDDWVVGGQGNDLLFGDGGTDLCYGQLGDDTVDGGAGNDAIVGGQANDLLYGGAGDDFITGDRGSDTLTGGSGADTFHTNNVTGLDYILDFNAAEGDRVLVDGGSTYQLRQSGADVIIDMSNNNQVVVVGVTLSSLPDSWISGG